MSTRRAASLSMQTPQRGGRHQRQNAKALQNSPAASLGMRYYWPGGRRKHRRRRALGASFSRGSLASSAWRGPLAGGCDSVQGQRSASAAMLVQRLHQRRRDIPFQHYGKCCCASVCSAARPRATVPWWGVYSDWQILPGCCLAHRAYSCSSSDPDSCPRSDSDSEWDSYSAGASHRDAPASKRHSWP